MTTLTRVASVAFLTSSLAGSVHASNVSSPARAQATQNSASVTGQNAPAPSIPHSENVATSPKKTPPTVDKNAQSSHTAAAATAGSQNTTAPQTALIIDTQSFTDAGIPANDEKSWIAIGVRDGRTAASLNHIFEQTVSNPHHKETDNPEFFNNIHPIVDALNDHKFTLGDLSTLIAEHHHQEVEGKAEELGPDLTNIIIDSAAKIHHGASAQETVSEITAQQHAIDEAEKKEQND